MVTCTDALFYTFFSYKTVNIFTIVFVDVCLSGLNVFVLFNEAYTYYLGVTKNHVLEFDIGKDKVNKALTKIKKTIKNDNNIFGTQ